jgi:uncharacterized membrane protein YjfL (UPF0719 family)
MAYNIAMMALYGAVYMALMYLLVYCNKQWCDYWSKRRGLNVDYAIEEDSNFAVALQRAGLYLGLAIGMYGVISGPSAGFTKDVLAILGYGSLVSVFFLGARVFNDYVILGFVRNEEQLKRGNRAVGFVECGGYIATGIIAMSSMIGQGGNALTAISFFIIGQILLLAVSYLYGLMTRWNLRTEIENGNAAAGLLLGGIMVAVAIAIHGAIASDFVSWGDNLTLLAIEGSLAVAFMLLLSKVVDWLFLPGTDIETEVVRDKNIAAITVVVATKIVGALAISAAVV